MIMIIDFHAHIYPPKIAEKATKSIGDFYNMAMAYHGNPDELIESGAKIGVTKYVVHSTATKPMQVESINNYIIDQMVDYPEFIGFGTMHPDFNDFEAELKRIKTEGLKGVKLHPDFQKFQVDTPKMDAVYDVMASLDLPVIVHAGDARYDFSGPKRIAHVLEKHPDLKLIAAHFGGFSEWKASMEFLVGKNVWFDTSSSLFALSVETADDMINKHGSEKFLFGSDFPMWDHEGEFERFNKLQLSQKQRDEILYKNAIELLGLKDLKD